MNTGMQPILVIIISLIMLPLATLGSLEFYVALKRPSENALNKFKANLPRFMQIFYFSQASIYQRYDTRTGFEYLMQSSTRRSGIFSWCFFTFMGNFLFIMNLFKEPPKDRVIIFMCFVVFLIYVLSLFFGITIKKEVDID